MRYVVIIIFSVIFCNNLLNAQDRASVYSFDFNKLKPIVQVFGTAAYDVENDTYDYSFGRAHLGFQYQFNENWSAKIIVDRGRATSVGDITVTDIDGNELTVENSSAEGSYYTMYLKFASLQWKADDKLTLAGGAILQNHYITQERFWGLRYVAQTFQDLYWKIPSSDLGFIATYKLSDVISLDAAITNGEGPREVQDAAGKVKFAGGIDFNPSQIIQTRFYYHNRQSSTSDEKAEQLFSVFMGYRPSSNIRVGGEFNYMNSMDYTENNNSYGCSFYSTYQVSNKTQLFVRYDRLRYESTDSMITTSENEGSAIMGGVSYSPVQGVNVSLNYKGWLSEESTNANVNYVSLSMEYKF